MVEEYKLFLNRNFGVDFCLDRALKGQGIEHEYITFKDHSEVCREHKIRLTPVLLVLKDGVEVERIFGVDDIVKKLKPQKSKTENDKNEKCSGSKN